VTLPVIGQRVRVELRPARRNETVLCGRLTFLDDDWVEITIADEPGNRQRTLVAKNDVVSIKLDDAT
jgi:hypothetical protein